MINETIKDMDDHSLYLQAKKVIKTLNNKYIKDFCTRYNVSEEDAQTIPHTYFTQGECGYYALMLYNIFAGKSKIYTTSTDGYHAVCKIGSYFYDVDGGNVDPLKHPDKYNEEDLDNDPGHFNEFISWSNVNLFNKKKTGKEIEEEEKYYKELENYVKEELGYVYTEKPELKY